MTFNACHNFDKSYGLVLLTLRVQRPTPFVYLAVTLCICVRGVGGKCVGGRHSLFIKLGTVKRP